MNHSSNYAYALWKYLHDENRSENGDTHAEAFTSLLKKRGHYKLLPTILKEFEKIESASRVKKGGILTCASNEDVERYRRELGKYGISGEDVVSVEVDKNLVGGFIYEAEDTVIDGCYRKQLLNLYREITA